jgi:hypothetical protein
VTLTRPRKRAALVGHGSGPRQCLPTRCTPESLPVVAPSRQHPRRAALAGPGQAQEDLAEDLAVRMGEQQARNLLVVGADRCAQRGELTDQRQQEAGLDARRDRVTGSACSGGAGSRPQRRGAACTGPGDCGCACVRTALSSSTAAARAASGVGDARSKARVVGCCSVAKRVSATGEYALRPAVS